jgi:hypothetical protein
MHRTRNAAYGQPYRGFESLPLRQSFAQAFDWIGLPAKHNAAIPHFVARFWGLVALPAAASSFSKA